VTGTITGYTPPTQTTPQSTSATATTIQTTVTPTDVNNVVYNSVSAPPPVQPDSSTTTTTTGSPTPLDELTDNSGSEGQEAADGLSQSLSQSLNPGTTKIAFVSRTLIPGVLTQVVAVESNGPHGVPPADEDYSSWGNEALWRW
jgi:hypothetical protein